MLISSTQKYNESSVTNYGKSSKNISIPDILEAQDNEISLTGHGD